MSDTQKDAMHITTDIWTRAKLVKLEEELAAANARIAEVARIKKG